MIENRFNLVDEDWIPVVGVGLVSLKRIFSDPQLKSLGGNPVQKISLMKLLLAICQTAATPEDDKKWAVMGAAGMAKKALAYLKEKKDCFWLYGERPFLQMKKIVRAEKTSFGSVLPYIATGNTTVLTQIQKEKMPTDAEQAQLVIQLMGFGLGGKKTDNNIVLSSSYGGKTNDKGKASTGKPGTAIGFLGYLHSFVLGENLINTLWYNLFSIDAISKMKNFTYGIGDPPWEKMPSGEACSVANKLKKSLMGRLLPISRFILLSKNAIHYSEGISHPTYKDGGIDPSIAIDLKGKVPRVLWSDPEKRPWRNLTSLLAFMDANRSDSFECSQLQNALRRLLKESYKIGIWSGGLRVSNNAGEQFVCIRQLNCTL